MAFILSDRVKEETITTGTDDIVLGGAYGGFQTFSTGVGDGNQTYYAIENLTRWEVGIGTYTLSTNTLSRDTVLDGSSGAGSKISLAGASIVFVTYAADRAVFLSGSGLIFPDETIQYSAVGTSTGPSGYLSEPPSSGAPLTLVRTSAGNLFHAYVDNANDRTIGLYLEDSTAPTWKLGLKNSPSSATAVPDQGYIYGDSSSAGMYAASDTSSLINYSNGFWITHKDSVLFNVAKAGGTSIDNAVASTVGVTVKGATAQSANLQEWTNSADTVLSHIDSGGAITVPKLHFSDGSTQSTAAAADDVSTASGALRASIEINTANLVGASGKLRTDVTGVSGMVVLSSGALRADILSLTGDISSNASAITANTALVVASGTAIRAESTANTANITTNAADIVTVSGTNTRRTYKTISADATLLISDCVVFVDSSSESIEIALPTAAGNGGKEFIFKRMAGSNVVTINPYGSETIDGSSSFGIDHLYESVTAISNNSHWYLV